MKIDLKKKISIVGLALIILLEPMTALAAGQSNPPGSGEFTGTCEGLAYSSPGLAIVIDGKTGKPLIEEYDWKETGYQQDTVNQMNKFEKQANGCYKYYTRQNIHAPNMKGDPKFLSAGKQANLDYNAPTDHNRVQDVEKFDGSKINHRKERVFPEDKITGTVIDDGTYVPKDHFRTETTADICLDEFEVTDKVAVANGISPGGFIDDIISYSQQKKGVEFSGGTREEKLIQLIDHVKNGKISANDATHVYNVEYVDQNRVSSTDAFTMLPGATGPADFLKALEMELERERSGNYVINLTIPTTYEYECDPTEGEPPKRNPKNPPPPDEPSIPGYTPEGEAVIPPKYIPCKDKDPGELPKGPERCPNSESKRRLKNYLFSTYPEEQDRTQPLFIDYMECPINDNAGWHFWNDGVFRTQMGNKVQSNNYISYMDGDNKGGVEPTNRMREAAYSTYVEYQTFFDDGTPPGKATAQRLDAMGGQYTITGLPTYNNVDGGRSWGFQYERDGYARNEGITLGMTPMEHGWYSRADKPPIALNPNNDGSHAGDPNPIVWTEDEEVDNKLKRQFFTDQPRGEFKVTWLEPMEGYESADDIYGAPKWRTGSNITRRCQKAYMALVKYARKIYEDEVWEYKTETTWKLGEEVWEEVCTDSWDYNPISGQYDYKRNCRQVFKECRYTEQKFVHDCYQISHCGKLPNGLQGDMWFPGELAAKGCYEFGWKPPIYQPARDWNYRNHMTTEFRGYITPDPLYPVGSESGNRRYGGGSGDADPAGNQLVPFLGDSGTRRNRVPGSSPGEDVVPPTGSSTRRLVKSGYGVAYNARVKVYSDWGRRIQKPRIAVINQTIAERIAAQDPRRTAEEFSAIIRPGKTTNIPINVPVGDVSAIAQVANNIDNNINVSERTNVYGDTIPSDSSAPDALYIKDPVARIEYNPATGDFDELGGAFIEEARLINPAGADDKVGGEYVWKQKSGLGVEYGTQTGYFHAYRKTKLKDNLVPALGRSRQHYIHLDYPNGRYSVGSIVELQMFKDPSDRQTGQIVVDLGGVQVVPTIRTKMGNYAHIEVKGNMYEDSYSAPENPYLDGTRGGH